MRGSEVDFIVNRGNKLNRAFTAYERNFSFNVEGFRLE
jgi:hypothetical protein